MNRILAFAALAFLPASEAAALTLTAGIRSISAEFMDSSGAVVAQQTNSESVTNDAPYSRPLSVFIGGSGFEASVGMATSGFFGIEAETFRSGRFSTAVMQLETYENDTAVPVDLSASFIVIDGLLNLVAGTGSTLRIDITSGEFPFGDFDGVGVLTATDFVSDYEEFGDPLNGEQAVPGGAVRLPFRRVTLDLGRLEPGESFDYVYSLSIIADAQIMEIANWVFVDPGAVDGLASPFVLSASPVGVAPVPLPAPAALLLSSLGLLIAVRARRAAA